MACCELGAKYNSREVLFESDNFFVAPTIGPLGKSGYMLIMSKQCFPGVGGMPESLYQELEMVKGHTTGVLREVYGVDSQIFEHGPRVGNFRGGGCLDHMHIHAVPGINIMDDVALDLWNRLENGWYHRVDRTDQLKRVADIQQQGQSSYLLVEHNDRRMIVEVNFSLDSQYVRRIIAKKTQRADKWDWGMFPEEEIVERTLDLLHGKFQ